MTEISPSTTAVKSICETLNITIGSHGQSDLFDLLAKESEFRVRQLIEPVKLLLETTNTKKLTTKHINEVIELQGEKPLLGYSDRSAYEITQHTAGTRPVQIISDEAVDLEKTTRTDILPPTREYEIKTELKMMNGVKVTTHQNASKSSKNIRRAPDHSGKEGSENIEKGVSKELVDFYQEIIDSLIDAYKVKMILAKLSQFGGLNPIIPDLLHYFISQIAQNLDSFAIMKSIGAACVALLQNPTVQATFYAHTFVHIGYTLAVKIVMTGTNDEDCTVRDIGANIVSLVAERCKTAFPNCNVEFFNKFSKYLFDENDNCVPIAYGALSGIFCLGKEFYARILPHLKFVLSWAKSQTKYDGHFCLLRKLIYDEACREKTSNFLVEESDKIIKFIDINY